MPSNNLLLGAHHHRTTLCQHQNQNISPRRRLRQVRNMHELQLDAGRCLRVAAILVEQVVLHLPVRSAPTSYRHTGRKTCVCQGSVHEHAMHRLPVCAADQHRKCNRQQYRPQATGPWCQPNRAANEARIITCLFVLVGSVSGFQFCLVCGIHTATAPRMSNGVAGCVLLARLVHWSGIYPASRYQSC